MLSSTTHERQVSEEGDTWKDVPKKINFYKPSYSITREHRLSLRVHHLDFAGIVYRQDIQDIQDIQRFIHFDG